MAQTSLNHTKIHDKETNNEMGNGTNQSMDEETKKKADRNERENKTPKTGRQ